MRSNYFSIFSSATYCLLLILSSFFSAFCFPPSADASQALDEVRSSQAISVDSKSAFAGHKQDIQQRLDSGDLKLKPLFEKNVGQVHENVEFFVRQSDKTVYILRDEIVWDLYTANKELKAHTLRNSAPNTIVKNAVRMKLVGASKQSPAKGLDKQRAITNYFIGNDPSKWHTRVANYAKINKKNIYPGIDLALYGNQDKELEYDFIVSPGANYSDIRLKFTGTESIKINKDGKLILNTSRGALVHKKPIIYQIIDGQRHTVDGHYILLSDSEVGFYIDNYDSKYSLVIDPVVIFSSGFAGRVGFMTIVFDIDVDYEKNVYIGGWTFSSDLPIKSAVQSALAGIQDSFVTKLTPAGDELLFSTFYGGTTGKDLLIALNASDNGVVIAGYTESQLLPLSSELISSYGGNEDGFIARLSPDGSVLNFSTYWGGAGTDQINDMEVDNNGNVYVTGVTWSDTGVPTTSGAYMEQAIAKSNGSRYMVSFVTKINPNNAKVVYSTFLGSSIDTRASAIAVDAQGAAYITGATRDQNIPVAEFYGNDTDTIKGGNLNASGTFLSSNDVMLFKLTPDGGTLDYSYRFGDSSRDWGEDIQISRTGNIYITGTTGSTNFPLINEIQDKLAGGWETFIVRFNTDGKINFSTYFGGSGTELYPTIEVSDDEKIYIAGSTWSQDLPLVKAVKTIHPGLTDVFIATIDPNSGTIDFSSLYGGVGHEENRGLAVDKDGNIYFAGGIAFSRDFPFKRAFQEEALGVWATGYFVKIGKLKVYLR